MNRRAPTTDFCTAEFRLRLERIDPLVAEAACARLKDPGLIPRRLPVDVDRDDDVHVASALSPGGKDEVIRRVLSSGRVVAQQHDA